LHASLLEVEVTESATVTKDGAVVIELAAIQKTGIKLYVDDFGTGYSCLAQLKASGHGRIEDRPGLYFAAGQKPGGCCAMFEAIVSMAHALEMRVVAEGVETVEQLAALQALGCEEAQGYYISRPVAAAEAGLLLQKRFLFPVA
jgi:EAL domain-containing protein (putative c-di-GMP-specific phosphodiesterase class I)